MTAYFAFTAEVRARVKEANPEAGVSETFKLIGAEWKALDEGGRQPYVETAIADKARYVAEPSPLPTLHRTPTLTLPNPAYPPPYSRRATWPSARMRASSRSRRRHWARRRSARPMRRRRRRPSWPRLLRRPRRT